jgi:hypothetical protein
MEKGKCKSFEEHSLAKEDTPSSESTSRAVLASSKGKKRTSASVALDSDSQLRRKLIKSGTTDIDPSLHKNSNLSGEAPLVTSKKRRRNPKDAESEMEDGTNKGTKRKKHSSPSENRQAPEITVEEDSVKPVGKRSHKVAKPTRKGKKNISDSSTTTSYGPSESREPPEINAEDSVKPIAKRSRKVAKSTRKDKKQNSDNSTTTSYVKRLRHYYIKYLNNFFQETEGERPRSHV